MGIGQKINQIANQVQTSAQSGVVQAVTWLVKIISSLVIALTISLIAQEIIGFGSFMLSFIMILTTGLFIKLMTQWRLGSVIVFDLICVLMALLLRTYILIAP